MKTAFMFVVLVYLMLVGLDLLVVAMEVDSNYRQAQVEALNFDPYYQH